MTMICMCALRLSRAPCAAPSPKHNRHTRKHTPLLQKTEFAAGYAAAARLTPDEAAALPDAINLRIFSNVVYFTGRAYAVSGARVFVCLCVVCVCVRGGRA